MVDTRMHRLTVLIARMLIFAIFALSMIVASQAALAGDDRYYVMPLRELRPILP